MASAPSWRILDRCVSVHAATSTPTSNRRRYLRTSRNMSLHLSSQVYSDAGLGFLLNSRVWIPALSRAIVCRAPSRFVSTVHILDACIRCLVCRIYSYQSLSIMYCVICVAQFISGIYGGIYVSPDGMHVYLYVRSFRGSKDEGVKGAVPSPLVLVIYVWCPLL